MVLWIRWLKKLSKRGVMHKKNLFLGSILLVAGCCIGAGMLGLPMAIISYGFIPSLLPLLFGWAYMNVSGLILLEGYQGVGQEVNLMGLMEKTLGKIGKYLCCFLFSVLFYSILTAYLSGTSIIISDAIRSILHIDFPQTLGIALTALLLFFGILYGVGEVDWINRIFITILFVAYFVLMAVGIFQVDFKNISIISINSNLFYSFPLFIVSFGFQNLIPNLFGYLKGDIKKVCYSFVIGSLIAFVVYLVFNFVILGLVSGHVIEHANEKEFITRLFKNSPRMISFFVGSFSFLAIVTSLLAISLSFVGFLSDRTEAKKNRAFYVACVVLPPLIFSFLNPNIFLFALSYAGVCAILLFGILPTLALWKMRYSAIDLKAKKIVPGEKIFLSIYLIISLGIVFMDLFK